jgi:uncharacterized membrane protein YdbT with pleckstrin-like domain
VATKEEKIERARKIAMKKMDFIRHFLIYLVVMVVLAIVNNTTWTGYQWWLWPALGWGIGIVAHFLSAFIYQGGSLEKRLVQRELEKMQDED